MRGNPILELASLGVLPHDIVEHLCQEDVAARITDSSINVVSDYLSWWFRRVSSDMPDRDSQDMLMGLMFGKEDWYRRFGAILFIGKVNYQAACLYAQDSTRARAASVLAQVYRRVGMNHAALALFGEAADSARNGEQTGLLLQSYIEKAKIYLEWNLPGKAWREIVAVLPESERVAPSLRAQIWLLAAEVLTKLNRNDEAKAYRQSIIDMPESATLPPPEFFDGWRERLWATNVFGEIQGPLIEGPVSLRRYTEMALGGLQGSLIRQLYTPYFGIEGSEVIQLALNLPTGPTWYYNSSYHELFDSLQRTIEGILLTRESISRREEGSEYLRSWANLIEALVDIGVRAFLPHRALEWLETFKATALVQRLGLRVGPCPDGVDPETWERLRRLVRNYRLVVESEKDETGVDAAQTSLSVSQLEAAIRKVTSSLRIRHPGVAENLGVLGLRRSLPPAAAFAKLSKNVCILEYFVGDTRGGCWLISPTKPSYPLWTELPELTKLAVGSVAEELSGALADWKQNRCYATRQRLTKALEAAIVFTSEKALQPLEAQSVYQTAQHLVVIPYGAIHALPFHAAIGADKPTVSYAPSLGVLAELREAPPPDNPHALIAADSMPNCPEVLCQQQAHHCWGLPGARAEAHALEKLLHRSNYQVTTAEGRSVTIGWLESQLPAVDIVHISTHAFFDAKRPPDSGLLITQDPIDSPGNRVRLPYWHHDGYVTHTIDGAVGTIWNLRRVWQRADLSCCHLLFLAGCETAVVQWEDTIDEFLGLPGGFLQSGATTVIGSVWNIGDLPAMLCTNRFYKNLLERNWRPSQALAEAQMWLRDLTVSDMLEESAELIMDYDEFLNGTPAGSPERALCRLLDVEALPPLDIPFSPFNSAFFWAAFRCIGLP